eukprot:GHVR01093397.1.p1 GENE.GHVR01093397.1~~GHVR01093397.1.p1  ORF type:complete len:277 (-),score=118.98 GHVR01093397.1:1025-1855(-)
MNILDMNILDMNILDMNILDINILWICEGEGESESRAFKHFISNSLNTEILQGVCGIITFSSGWVGGTPSLVIAKRGVVDVTLTVSGGSADLHSGIHGGPVAEPLVDLLGLCANLVDSTGYVTVPGFYSGVRIDDSGVKSVNRIDDSGVKSVYRIETRGEETLMCCCDANSDACVCLDLYKKYVGHANLRGDDMSTILHKRWCEPTLTVSEVYTSSQGVPETDTHTHTHTHTYTYHHIQKECKTKKIKITHTRTCKYTHTHTHTHIYVYIMIYTYM